MGCYRRRNQWLRLALALFCLPLIWLARVVYLLVGAAEGHICILPLDSGSYSPFSDDSRRLGPCRPQAPNRPCKSATSCQCIDRVDNAAFFYVNKPKQVSPTPRTHPRLPYAPLAVGYTLGGYPKKRFTREVKHTASAAGSQVKRMSARASGH